MTIVNPKTIGNNAWGSTMVAVAYCCMMMGSAVVADRPLTICLVSGSAEYESDTSLDQFKADLETQYHVRCKRVYSTKQKGLDNLDALAKADLALFFTKRLNLDAEQLQKVQAYVASGKPIVGIRTASHGFQNWLEMDAVVFGGDYQGHGKHNVTAKVNLTKDDPLLKGVKPFTTEAGVYKNPNLAKDVVVIMTATTAELTEPVSWYRTRTMKSKQNQRVFYSSLGSPADFQNENFQRLLYNAIDWATEGQLKPITQNDK